MDRRGEIQDLYHLRGQIRRTRALSVQIFWSTRGIMGDGGKAYPYIPVQGTDMESTA